MKTLLLLSALGLTACAEPAARESSSTAPAASGSDTAPVSSDRPMDEVPAQRVLADGGREYRFDNGCVIVLEADRAVVTTESEACALFHRDIALLYASGD